MQVMLIRHGQTAGNAQRRYIGRTDEPLSQEGIAAAALAGVDETRKTVYVTPLRRTQQTAEILFPNAEQIVVPDLREMDFGVFEGRTAGEMSNDPAYRAWVDGECRGQCPGGESTADFCQRVCTRFEKLLRSLDDRETCPAFVVHGGTIMAIMERFADPVISFYDAFVPNCQGYMCCVEFTPRFRLTDKRALETSMIWTIG